MRNAGLDEAQAGIKTAWRSTRNLRYADKNAVCTLYDHSPRADGVITHLEPDILGCEVKWALGNITTNKARGGDGIPGKLSQIPKGEAVNVLH